MTDWETHARDELFPKMASSAYVITLAPDEVDPKIALETGYAVLMDKPIIVISWPGHRPSAGLLRVAHAHIEMTQPFSTEAGQHELMLKLAALGVLRDPD